MLRPALTRRPRAPSRGFTATARHLSAYLQLLRGPCGARARHLVRLRRGLSPGAVTGALAAGAGASGHGGLCALRVAAGELPAGVVDGVLRGLAAGSGAGARAVAAVRADALRDPGLRAVAAAAAGALQPLAAAVQVRPVGTDAPRPLLALLARAAAARSPHARPPFATRVRAARARAFAAFHPAAPDAPLALAEAALLPALPRCAADVLASPPLPGVAPAPAVAAFYSVVAVHPGLAGLGVPAALVKDAVRRVADEGARRTITFSPVPGFRPWLAAHSPRLERELRSGGRRQEALYAALRSYLVEERRTGGAAVDPVANFHLGNGARLQDILLDADPSLRRVEESFGAMVIYEYCQAEMDRNRERYLRDRVINTKV